MTRFLDGEDDEDGSPNVEKAVCECDWRLIQERETDTIQNILFFTPFQSCELWFESENLHIVYVHP